MVLRLVLAVLAMSAATASAQPKQKIAILGLEARSADAPNKDTIRVAQEVTIAVRARAKSAGPYAPAANSERELVDEKLLNDCQSEERSCMARIGAALGADILVYGNVEWKKTFGGFQISLKVLDVGKQQMRAGWTDLVPMAEASGTTLSDHATRGYTKLVGASTGTPAPSPPAPAPQSPPIPPAPSNCDFYRLVEKGDTAVQAGLFSGALASYEQALRCKPTTTTIMPKLYLASCKARLEAKAKLYYKKMTAAQQRSYAQICIREGIDPR